jgi:hypothetical protein
MNDCNACSEFAVLHESAPGTSRQFVRCRTLDAKGAQRISDEGSDDTYKMTHGSFARFFNSASARPARRPTFVAAESSSSA